MSYIQRDNVIIHKIRLSRGNKQVVGVDAEKMRGEIFQILHYRSAKEVKTLICLCRFICNMVGFAPGA